MAKKSTWGDSAKSIFEALLNASVSNLKTKGSELIEHVQQEALILEERLIKRAVFTGLFGIAFLVFALAGFFYLVEYLSWTVTHALLALGVLLLAAGIWAKMKYLQDLSK